MSRSPTRTTADRALALACVAALSAAAAGAKLPWRFPYSAGDPVRIQGTVADPAGRPIAGLEVTLEAAKPRFDWRRLSSTAGDLQTRKTTTDERGQFALDWTWDPAFRRFDLVATIRVEAAGRVLAHELARLDVADRLEQGSPAAVALVVESSGYVERLRAFVAELESADERRVWSEMGLPDSVDRVESAGAAIEAAWWYFGIGRVARFREGRLVQVEEFPPVRPIGERGPP